MIFKRHLPLLLLLACPMAAAQSVPPPGLPGPGMVPSPAMLATLPGLSVSQQQQLRQLLLQRRDAREALFQREQAALEQIDTDSANRIRSLLGEQAYVRYAQWSMGGPAGPGGQNPPPPPPQDQAGNGSALLPPDLDSNGTPPAPSRSHQ